MKKSPLKRPKKINGSGHSLAAAGAVCLLTICGAAVLMRPGPVASKPVTDIIVAGDQDLILVPTPNRAIARGEKLGAVEFVKMKWPKTGSLANYVQDEAQFAGAAALTPLPAYLPVPVSALSGGSADGNAVVEGIPQGLRAITVRVDAESAVEGWARSGNYVDVIVLRQSADSDLGTEAKVIAENVKILSAGRSTEPLGTQASAPSAPPTITLLVTQEDALKIKTAASIGRLTFSLRGAGDESPTVSLEMSQKALLGTAKSFTPGKERYLGTAKGPDGKAYLLADDARWVRAPDMDAAEPPQPEPAAPAAAEPEKEQRPAAAPAKQAKPAPRVRGSRKK